MFIRTNLSQGAEVGPELSINNAVKTLKIVQASELEDLRLLFRAISVCAQRDKVRTEVKFPSGSPEIKTKEKKVETAQGLELATASIATETTAGVLRLLQ